MKKKGITLIEVIIGMAIMVVVFAMVNNIFFNTNKLLSKVDTKASLQDKARTIINYIGEDIKGASLGTTNVRITAGKLYISNTEIPMISNLITPILYLERNGNRYMYGKLRDGTKEKYKKIQFTIDNTDPAHPTIYTNDCKVFGEEVLNLDIEDKTGSTASSLSSIFSINLTVKQKNETKSYNTATFIVKGANAR